jgi:hypothetical protein
MYGALRLYDRVQPYDSTTAVVGYRTPAALLYPVLVSSVLYPVVRFQGTDRRANTTEHSTPHVRLGLRLRLLIVRLSDFTNAVVLIQTPAHLALDLFAP